eukprot:TRINITY_DN21085_c0_g1_i1.p1 TRINITY_DN21085_c0_g1~~TRINITY_DN21085_c0_g1_i1.p1  ORF type:complete len:377 (+),score=54.84 TRINITY_DN21085_c0_g1_i1:156-1133(+)
MAFAGKKKRETSEIIKSGGDTPPARELMDGDCRRLSYPNADGKPGVDFEGELEHPLVRPSTPPSPSRLTRRSSSASSDDTQTSEASTGSHASHASRRSIRTAASTKALVDLVKLQVAGIQASVPPQPPRPLEKSRRENFSIGANLRKIRAQEGMASPRNGKNADDGRLSPVDHASDWSNDISTGKDSLGELMSEVGSEASDKKTAKPLKRMSSERWKLAAKEALRRDKLEKATVTNMNELKVQMGIVMRRQEEQSRTLATIIATLSTLTHTVHHHFPPPARPSRTEPPPSPPAMRPSLPDPQPTGGHSSPRGLPPRKKSVGTSRD